MMIADSRADAVALRAEPERVPFSGSTSLLGAGDRTRKDPEAGTGKPAIREALLRGAIAPTLLRLALPILVVLAVQTLVSVAETYFVGFLGTDALAGVALVFPALMLMTMMSNGGIGGGVSSAIARAIGAGRLRDADALVSHTVIIALVFGGLFSAALLGGGRALYAALGGSGEVLANALRYSSLVFGAAIPIWITNLLAAALRGAGNVRVPAILTAVGAAMTLALSPLLIFGWGPVPRFGVAGAGLAMILYYVTRDNSADCVSAFAAHTRSPCPYATRVASVQGHPGRGYAVRNRDDCRQPHGRAGDGSGRQLWRRGDRRLRDGITS